MQHCSALALTCSARGRSGSCRRRPLGHRSRPSPAEQRPGPGAVGWVQAAGHRCTNRRCRRRRRRGYHYHNSGTMNTNRIATQVQPAWSPANRGCGKINGCDADRSPAVARQLQLLQAPGSRHPPACRCRHSPDGSPHRTRRRSHHSTPRRRRVRRRGGTPAGAAPGGGRPVVGRADAGGALACLLSAALPPATSSADLAPSGCQGWRQRWSRRIRNWAWWWWWEVVVVARGGQLPGQGRCPWAGGRRWRQQVDLTRSLPAGAASGHRQSRV